MVAFPFLSVAEHPADGRVAEIVAVVIDDREGRGRGELLCGGLLGHGVALLLDVKGSGAPALS